MTPMAAVDSVSLHSDLVARGVRLQVGGGWGIDAPFGRQTRPHNLLLQRRHGHPKRAGSDAPVRRHVMPVATSVATSVATLLSRSDGTFRS
ncbi:MAG: hypothetical protein AVDCRST_MAG01-01-4167 [uncultured Rubrobacteraceae bacterium]|uniref:Uncharacterized protein n=1 Tax=uncultured Rubrobacteraceae bacterium TaxID=349277 RepID=A0A6J4QN14_9ACTN|nr:MAG: hypothetical protein AVDCRST_MAG01-01-4167 [uncultured Rubrobacteraceae bacterium]